jgi:hypothetical protein
MNYANSLQVTEKISDEDSVFANSMILMDAAFNANYIYDLKK